MERYQGNYQDRRGNAIADAEVLVRTEAGATATIFSDDGVTTASNPLTTDTDGEYSFFAANGKYTIQISATGYATETISDQILFDPADFSASSLFDASAGATIANYNIVLDSTGADATAVPVGRMTFKEVATATYTAVPGDAGLWINVTAAATATFNIVTATGFQFGDTMIIKQRGAGQVVLAAAAGITLQSSDATKTREQYAVIAATYESTNVWSVYGDTATT